MKTNDLMRLLSITMIVFSSCKGQTNKGEVHSSSDSKIKNSTDSVRTPQYKINVNKQYDNSGQLIKYDSSYSYSFYTPGGRQQITEDSLYTRFREYFQKNYSNLFNPPVNDMFYQDSLFKYDFFNNDYFMKRFEMNNEVFDKIYKQMDSLKADFLQKNFPNGRQNKNK